MKPAPIARPRAALSTLVALGALLGLVAPIGPGTQAGAAEPEATGCGDSCRATGLEVTVTEITVAVRGFTLEQVDQAWCEATRDIAPATPRLSGLEVCYRCGSTELAEAVSLRYELTMPLPAWEPSSSVSDTDRTAILRYIAALQGRANRLVGDHREALDQVVVRNKRPEEIRAEVEAACERALEQDEILLRRDGCVMTDGPLEISLGPITSCLPKWKPTPANRCRLQK